MANLVLLINGLADDPLQDLGGLTPLEMAKHPNLDEMLESGEALSISPPAPASFLSSLHSFLAGKQLATSQALSEAVALGHQFSPNQGAFSCLFASIGQGTVVDLSDHLLTDREGQLLCEVLNHTFSTDGCHFYHVEKNRFLLVSNNSHLTDLLPLHNKPITHFLESEWRSLFPSASLTAVDLLNQMCQCLASNEINTLKEDFEEPPVNGLVFLEGGKWNQPDQTAALTLPEDTLIITKSPGTVGLAKSLGLDAWCLPEEEEKFSHIPLVLHHLPDLFMQRSTLIWEINYLWRCTLNGHLLEKVKTIEYLDRQLLKPLKNLYQSSLSGGLLLFPLTHTSIHPGVCSDGAVPGVWFPKHGLKHPSVTFTEKITEASSSSQLAIEQLSQTLP